jgi:hypothetical protein
MQRYESRADGACQRAVASGEQRHELIVFTGGDVSVEAASSLAHVSAWP